MPGKQLWDPGERGHGVEIGDFQFHLLISTWSLCSCRGVGVADLSLSTHEMGIMTTFLEVFAAPRKQGSRECGGQALEEGIWGRSPPDYSVLCSLEALGGFC